MQFGSYTSIPATPFNANPNGPTPDTITVNGKVIKVQKFPEGRAEAIDVVNETPIVDDNFHGPDQDEYDGCYHGEQASSMDYSKPFGTRKTW